jgi:hypothetical protein
MLLAWYQSTSKAILFLSQQQEYRWLFMHSRQGRFFPFSHCFSHYQFILCRDIAGYT